MSELKFRMAAKTDVGLERSNNEDNFQVSANLEESPMRWINNQEYSLGRKGALLVVADGMGGMNAGEVASDIAIKTVREMFSPDKITDEIVKTRFTIEKFMKGVVIEADKRIKEYAKEHPDSRGMGTTIVIGWLFDGNLYVTWCGDSRAYIYNPSTGLFQISKDHSYVQQLVDKGKISKEDAFDFPDSNIITRSLSDATPKAVPDCLLKPQPLCDGDIIMLCSDGLNGMIRDNEIEAVIEQNQDNMTNCVDALIHAALEAAGADNCTVALCQIISGGAKSEQGRIPVFNSKPQFTEPINNNSSGKKKTSLWMIVAVLLLAILSCIAIFIVKGNPFADPEKSEIEQFKDTVDKHKEDVPSEIVENESEDKSDGGEVTEDDEKDDTTNDNINDNVKVSKDKKDDKKDDKPTKKDKDKFKKDKEKEYEETDTGLGFKLTPIQVPEDEEEWTP